MNHSVEFIEGFVDSMEAVMDRKIREHIHAIDTVKQLLEDGNRGLGKAAPIHIPRSFT